MSLRDLPLEVFDCEQGTEEWFQCRIGIPTASEFATVMASGKDGGDSKTRAKYLRQLAAQRISGNPSEGGFKSKAMERGNALEPEARALYQARTDLPVTLVGFMKRGEAGASPDAMVGADGLLELKTRQHDLQIELLLSGKVPTSHRQQIQGQLLISGRQWLDFGSYCPGLPMFIRRVEPDLAYQQQIEDAIGQFLIELKAMVARVIELS